MVRGLSVPSAESRQQDAHTLNDRRSEDDDEDRREDEEHEREEQLDRQLAGELLGALGSLRTHRVRVNAQRLAHARSEAVGLDEQRDEALHLGDVAAPAEVGERLGTRESGAKLERDE